MCLTGGFDYFLDTLATNLALPCLQPGAITPVANYDPRVATTIGRAPDSTGAWQKESPHGEGFNLVCLRILLSWWEG
jgi:hypothetical protein